jgi:quercetin dioxygenase-like cupin family protein
MPLVQHAAVKPVEMLPGVVRRTLNAGQRTMLIEVSLDEGAVVPWHTHPHEQVGYLVSGRLLFELGEEERLELGPGDSWLVPSGVPHQATALEPCRLVDVFSPPREEYR